MATIENAFLIASLAYIPESMEYALMKISIFRKINI